jgi:biotin operon repressor
MMSEVRIESKLEGFAPLIKVLIPEVGLYAAAVYGEVWRYAQQKNKVCYASIGKIAKELYITERTVIKSLKALREGGYLIDYTPNLRNKPHTYGVSDKVRILQTTQVIIEDSPSTMNLIHPAMNKIQCESELDSLEYRIRKNKDTKTQTDVCDGGNDSKTSSTTIREKGGLERGFAPVGLGFLGKEYRGLGQAFLEHAGVDYSPNSDGDKRLWIKELKTWRGIGASAKDIRSVITDMRKRGLSIKSPTSITGMLRDCKARQSNDKTKVFAGNESDLY